MGKPIHRQLKNENKLRWRCGRMVSIVAFQAVSEFGSRAIPDNSERVGKKPGNHRKMT